MKVVLGDACYPKSEALILPANTKGVMSRGLPSRIVKDGLSTISKESKQFITNNKVEMGDCFSTEPGRLKRRGLKRIYHAVIKRLQGDFSSIYIIDKALDNALREVMLDNMKSVAVCGLGIEGGDLDPTTVARITVEVCSRYDERIEIKIIDSNEEFITEVDNLIKE